MGRGKVTASLDHLDSKVTGPQNARGASQLGTTVLVLPDIGTSLPAGHLQDAAHHLCVPFVPSPGPGANIWEAERGKLL